MVTGLELSEVRARQARKRLAASRNAEVLVGSIESGIDRTDGYYDLILWADVIEHVVNLFEAMAEVSRLLAPNGVLVTITPNIAYLPRRIQLLLGRFPATGSSNEGLGVRPGELFDAGHMHYFTFGALKNLYRQFHLTPTREIGFGNRLSRVRNFWPSVLSGSVYLAGVKQESKIPDSVMP